MKTFSSTWSLAKFASSTILLTVIPLTSVYATIIPADVSITAVTNFDTVNSFGDTSGDFSLTGGGTTTTHTYNGSDASPETLSGTLLNIDDGIGFSGNVSVSGEANEYLVGFDSNISLQNNSGSEIYDVVLKLIFSNSVTASGEDAYADSEFIAFGGLPEEFFSDLISDSVFGNAINGTLLDPEQFGGNLLDEQTLLFDFVLNPAETLDLSLFWTLEGGSFTLSSESQASFSQFLSVESIIARSLPPTPSVPSPNSVSFFVIVFAGLLAKQCRKRKTQSTLPGHSL